MDVPEVVNVMSIDVEDYYHVAAFADRITPDRWPSYPARVARNTERLLEIFERHNVRATFFVLGWVAERERSLVESIAKAGHEVACHGYSHALIYKQTPEQFRQETHQAKALLEEITQTPVMGYRAASWSVVAQTRWALDVLLDVGFQYDSSIFPIHHDRYGIPGAVNVPHRATTPLGRTIAEFPPATVRLPGVTVPAGGGGYFRIYPYAMTRRLLASINRAGQPFAFYVHPWEIDPGQPRLPASPLSRFRHYTNLHRCEPRLQSLLSQFRFAPMREVLTAHGLLGPRSVVPEAA